jgi:hypothetical protein
MKINTPKTPTLFMLMGEFDSRPAVPLEECLHYVGLTKTEANRAITDGKLQLPTFRMRDSQKAPRMVHLSDLAEFIDNHWQPAKQTYNKVKGVEDAA